MGRIWVSFGSLSLLAPRLGSNIWVLFFLLALVSDPTNGHPEAPFCGILEGENFTFPLHFQDRNICW